MMGSHLILPAALLIPTALFLPVWARVCVRFASGRSEVGPGLLGTGLAVILGYLGVLIAIRGGEVPLSIEAELALSTFGALLLVAAWTDHRTAWAPDGVTLPLILGATVSAGLLGTLGVGPLGAIGIALALFLASQAAWALQALTGRRHLPPADLMALALPALLFGTTIYAPITYMALSGLLVLLLRAPDPLYQVLRGPAADEAVQDAGLVGRGRSAPLLPLAYTALFGTLLFRLFQG
jgi:hypothetical protein